MPNDSLVITVEQEYERIGDMEGEEVGRLGERVKESVMVVRVSLGVTVEEETKNRK